MKKAKRLAALVLGAAMLFTCALSGCGGGDAQGGGEGGGAAAATTSKLDQIMDAGKIVVGVNPPRRAHLLLRRQGRAHRLRHRLGQEAGRDPGGGD